MRALSSRASTSCRARRRGCCSALFRCAAPPVAPGSERLLAPGAGLHGEERRHRHCPDDRRQWLLPVGEPRDPDLPRGQDELEDLPEGPQDPGEDPGALTSAPACEAPSAPLLSADCSAGRWQEYFNWHHRNTREITISSFAPAMRPDLGLAPSPINPATLKTIERWLGESAWLIGDQPTVADFSCFCELGQAQSHLCDFIDFGTRRAAFSELNPSQFSKKSCAAQSRTPTSGGGWARASSWMDSRRATRCCSRSGRSSLRRSRRPPNSSSK